MNLLKDFQALTIAQASRGGRPFAYTVHGENDGILER